MIGTVVSGLLRRGFDAVCNLALIYPETLGGWVAVAAGVSTIAAIIGGVVVTIVDRRIAAQVAHEVHREVRAVVTDALREVNAKLDGIRINQESLSAEVGIVRRLEAKLENGISRRVESIDTRQDALVEQIAEIHGWIQATRDWDGKERRQ